MSHSLLRINFPRFKKRLDQLAEIGALEAGGVCRLSLDNEDKKARDFFKKWTEELGLELEIDSLGNMFAVREGETQEACVMSGSHLDTVGTGGIFDGSLGVVAAMEIMAVLNEQEIKTKRPFKVANFTNEEGVRFTPDMMGSLGFKGGLTVEEIYQIRSVDGSVIFGEELEKIGYKGKQRPGSFPVSAFVELHIEQGPVLEKEAIDIAAVTGVQGIFWTEYVIKGRTAHAGTTPLELRNDAGLTAAQLTVFVRERAKELGGVGTVGIQEYSPNLINVVAEKARITTDLRHPDQDTLMQFQHEVDNKLQYLCTAEGTSFQSRELVRIKPVNFAEDVVSLIEEKGKILGYSINRMVSGAGHDAQMMADLCPTSMIFVPSVKGVSHNIEEFTKDEDLERGANTLLHVLLELLNK